MTKNTLLAVFGLVLCCLISHSAATKGLRGPANPGQILLAMKSHPQLDALMDNAFGAHIIETVALQLELGGTFDQVLKMLEDMKKSLEAEQQTADMDYTTLKKQLEDQIKLNKEKSAKAASEFATSTENVKDLEKKITVTDAAQFAAKKQVAALKKQRDALEAAHKKDEEHYTKRIGEQRQVVVVLHKLIEDLTDKVVSAGGMSLAQKNEIFQQLETLGSSNPLAGLVQLSSTLDVNSLKIVIGKMQHLLEEITETIQADEASHKRSAETYKAMSTKMQEIADQLNTNFAALKTTLKLSKKNLITEKEKIGTSKKLQTAADAARKASENQLADARNEYKKQKGKRMGTLKVVKDAIRVLQASNATAGKSAAAGGAGSSAAGAPPKF